MILTIQEDMDIFNMKTKILLKNVSKKSMIYQMRVKESPSSIKKLMSVNSKKREKDPITKITFTSKIFLNFPKKKLNKN